VRSTEPGRDAGHAAVGLDRCSGGRPASPNGYPGWCTRRPSAHVRAGRATEPPQCRDLAAAHRADCDTTRSARPVERPRLPCSSRQA
jgi:hypothetical protein